MKRLTLSNVFLFLIFCALPLTAHVQNPQGIGSYAPQGSYLQSCVGASFNSATQVLSASCFSDRREIVKTGEPEILSLNVSFCAPGADIENIRLDLTCTLKAGSWGDRGAAPSGSYRESCYNWYVQSGTLTATCWNYTKGKLDYNNQLGFNYASLDLTQCGMNGDIENIRGQLICTQPAGASNPTAPTPASGTCKQGFVWREATPSDHVCVTSATRQQTANDNAAAYTRTNMHSAVPQGQPHVCLQGFVWREAVPGDFACVLPYVREQAAADNAASPSRTY